MPLQMVGPGGELKYNPARDIVHLMPPLLTAVADRLEDGPWPPLRIWLQERGVTMDELGEAMQAYCRFMQEGVQSPRKPMGQVVAESGWNDTRWEAQLAVMYYVGGVCSGSFFKGARDANNPNQQHVQASVKALVAAGLAAERYFSMSRWQRWLWIKSRLFRRLFGRAQGIELPDY